MTREEAIDIVKCLAWHDLRPSEEDIKQAIKTLEQEPTNIDLTCVYAKGVYDTREETATILNKISAEIKDYFSITCDGNCDNCNRVVKNPCGESVDGAWVLHIIDKYKVESEET